MKINKKLMNEIEELWADHDGALAHFGLVCVEAAKAGRKAEMRRCLRRGMVIATVVTIVVTSCLDLISESY